MEQFLQHTSRDDDVHLHVHNVIATIAQTIMDGKWRTPDSWGYNEVFMAVSAIVSLHLEAAMRRRLGVGWIPRGCQCPHGRCQHPAPHPSNFRPQDDDVEPDAGMLRRAARKALARSQAQQSKWTRYQLIHELGSVRPPAVRDLKPERMLPLLEDLADRTLAGDFEPVVCLEAPELIDVPDSLRRSDGRPVYQPHMTAQYATAAHLSLEEQLLADAGRRRAPLIERERAAQLLGSDSAQLAAQLNPKPEAGTGPITPTLHPRSHSAAHPPPPPPPKTPPPPPPPAHT